MLFLEDLILVVHVLVTLAIIGLVLLQQGRGAEMGAGFGAGASATLFGSSGSATFLTRMTTLVAVVFFVTSLSLAYIAKVKSDQTADLGIPVVQDVETGEGEILLPELTDDDAIAGDDGASGSAVPESGDLEVPQLDPPDDPQ